MAKNRVLIVGAYVAAAALLVAGVAVLVRDRTTEAAAPDRIPVSDLPELAPMPFPTTLATVRADGGVVGSQIEVAATSFSDRPLAEVRLYDGARRVATATPASAGAPVVALTYPALSVGPHALFVEATDADGRTSRSPATTVAIGVAPGPGAIVPLAEKLDPAAAPSPDPAAEAGDVPVQVPVTADEGETGVELAERFGVDPSQLALLIEQDGATVDVPDLDPSLPIPAGARPVLTVKGNAGADALGGAKAIVDSPIITGPGSEAATMGLEATADGCEVALTAEGSDGEVSYFDGAAGVPGWASVGQTDGDGELRLPTPTPGVHVYFARTAERTSQTVSVTVPISCAAEVGWTGTAKIVDGRLYLPPAAAGRVYLYLQVDGATSVRIPSDDQRQGRAINAGTVTDIRGSMPDLAALDGSSAELSVMRGDEFPVEVASGSLQVPEGRTLVEIIGEPGAIDLQIDVPEGAASLSSPTNVQLGYDDEELTLRWDAASDRVDEVLWQVVSAPNDVPSFTAPTVLAAGISDASPADDGTGTQGSFTLDTASIPGHGPDDAPAPGTVGKVQLLTPAVTPGTLLQLTKPTAAKLLASDVALDPATQQLAVLPGPGERIYVRVTANPKGPAMGTSSNPVSVVLPTPEPPESVAGGVTMEVDSFTLEPGRAPSADYVGCAQVKLGPYYGQRPLDNNRPQNAAHLVYTSGSGVYCYVPPPPESDECDLDFLGGVGDLACDAYEVLAAIEGAVVDLFESAYEIGSQIYNGAIDTLVTFVADFNPVCIALGQASEDAAAACKETTAMVASSVISSALASFGLPPRLPSLDQLEALAKGELAAIAVVLMEQAGVPCQEIKASPEVTTALDAAGGKAGGLDVSQVAADPCLAMAKGLIDLATKSLTRTMSSQTSAATGLPDFNITGFSIKPVPQSLPEPMQVRLTMHPADPDLDVTGLACAVSVSPSAEALRKYQGDPAPFRGAQLLTVREDGPVDGKGTFSGSAVFSEFGVHPYPGVPPLSTRLKDLDVTMTIDQGTRDEVRSREVIHYYDACLGAQASVTERVRPPDA